jgi:protein associated with RNAse G/E
MRFSAGTPVRCQTRKWPDQPHWSFDGFYLGEDEHGDWLGFPAGTHNSRPGYAFDSEVDSVTLAPPDAWWIATFHAPGIWCDLYIDICTPVEWGSHVARCVDLDLDVIRMSTAPQASLPPGKKAGPGELFIDDEDEFAEHQVAYGYPADVITRARAAADAVTAQVEAASGPFAGVADAWIETLRSLPRT